MNHIVYVCLFALTCSLSCSSNPVPRDDGSGITPPSARKNDENCSRSTFFGDPDYLCYLVQKIEEQKKERQLMQEEDTQSRQQESKK